MVTWRPWKFSRYEAVMRGAESCSDMVVVVFVVSVFLKKRNEDTGDATNGMCKRVASQRMMMLSDVTFLGCDPVRDSGTRGAIAIARDLFVTCSII